jgi:hypothetical protein
MSVPYGYKPRKHVGLGSNRQKFPGRRGPGSSVYPMSQGVTRNPNLRRTGSGGVFGGPAHPSQGQNFSTTARLGLAVKRKFGSLGY